MATQEQLILAQLGAKEADIYKPDVDTGSGFVQDITAGIMGAQAFDESAYALEGAVKDFRKDYYKGDIKEDSLMGRIGLKAFGPNVKFSELSAAERRDIRRGPQLEARGTTDITSSDAFKFNPDLYAKNLEDDYAVAENVELSSNGEMITVPFDVKKEIIDPALKAEVDVPTTFVGPVGNVSQSQYDNIYKGKPTEGFKYGGVNESSLIPNEEGNVTQDIFAYNVNAPGDTTFARYRGQSPNLAVAGNKAFQNFQQGNYTEVSAEEYRGNNNAD
jgi:hypothetical protein